MPQLYAEVLRGPIGFRDNNFLVGWAAGGGVSASTNGDVVTVNGTSPGSPGGYFGITLSALSTTTYPYLVVRSSGTGTITLVLTYTSGSDTFTVNLTSSLSTQTFNLTTGKTVSTTPPSLYVNGQSNSNVKIDYVYLCAKSPIQLSSKDLKNGTVTRTSLGNDHAELELANYRGKYTASIFGSGGTNAIGFGDHLHIYLGQGATLFHVYGGYVELQEPVQPPDNMLLHSRGFGLALLRSKVLQIYNNQTPQAIVQDEITNFINASNKNGLGIASNYQLTSTFVQNIGSSIPLYVASLNNAFNTLHEIADLTVYQGTPAIFFVDPAENLHWVPLGTQGSANWNTDPYSATYGTTLAYGTNLTTVNLSRDTQSLANRVHYYGIAQIPGLADSLSDYASDGAFSSAWGIEDPVGSTSTNALHSVSSPVAIGGHANNVHSDNSNNNTNPASAAMYYPNGKNLGLDLTKIGSQWTPPIMEFYIRWHNTGGGAHPNSIFSYIYFAKDINNWFQYIISAAATPQQSILGTNVNGDITPDFWYHVLVPIGPYAGNLVLSAPTPNLIAQPTSLAVPWLGTGKGSLAWSDVTYIGFENDFQGSGGGVTGTSDMYIDGFRILGPRYRLAYDNRSVANGRYPDMSEAYYYDPVSKDETAIKAFAASELLKLRNGILRGTVTTPLLADIVPEQQVKLTVPSANLSAQYLRCTSVVHHFSNNAYMTELSLTDDFTNARPLDRWKLMNALLEMGENAIFSRQLVDMRTAILDPTFTPITDPYT